VPVVTRWNPSPPQDPTIAVRRASYLHAEGQPPPVNPIGTDNAGSPSTPSTWYGSARRPGRWYRVQCASNGAGVVVVG